MVGSPSDASLTKLVQSITLLTAVSRHGSFAGAAQDLGLDPSAVSHRIRALEAALGLALFDRTTRRVRPNRAGEILCQAANRSLDEVERAGRRACAEVEKLDPTFASFFACDENG
ncbi:LysR family transcriptional regulator [Chachezhania antarctica]|uniref:LysR family transcriptional regulator n=1 Tax=Chachezhania antarctica TaxID=2340860 RepID=UPI000EB2E01B|nr:LysR family transcriptional regulator [Chachezhania antarctica]|tara:strand:- start:2591 stop:2935 length:345 start_codon:yes stop_codon:yes gene_type:complete